MAAAKNLYVCQVCASVFHRWIGKCSGCGSWDTIVGEIVDSYKKNSDVSDVKVVTLNNFNEESSSPVRFSTGMEELDRVFGCGGVVLGSSILIGGEPGVGKSTLVLQVASFLAKNFASCLYASGEESVEQIKLRARRLNISEPRIKFISTASFSNIMAVLKGDSEIKFLIIDSIQTVYNDKVSSIPGTIVQVRLCAQDLISFAKRNDIVLFILGQITKDGQIAGPKTLEHMVDTVLYFEGENSSQFRILRTVKNRFGPTNEIGVFEMSEGGLVSVINPSSLFLTSACNNNYSSSIGSSVFAGVEGSRPILMEVQALVAKSHMATPRRAVVGWDINRLAMIIAVLSSRCNIFLGDKEVYLNIGGGLKICEPAADLSVASALISSITNVSPPESTVFFGEIALSGEIRNVSNIDLRLKESFKLGFKKAIIPINSKYCFSDIEIIKVDSVLNLKRIFK